MADVRWSGEKKKRQKKTGSALGRSDNKTEAFISRNASGMCFDFSTKDPNIYLAGTEEGRWRRACRLYLGIADGSRSASPTALYRHRRRLDLGITDGSRSASPTALYRHRRRHARRMSVDVPVLAMSRVGAERFLAWIYF